MVTPNNQAGEPMDPDFMKHDNADRPFGPAPEPSLMRWIAAMLVLLALVYAGYRVWESSSNRASPPKTRQDTSATSQPLAPPRTSAPPQSAAPAPQAPGTHVVSKCVVNGKTLYSDNACPQGTAGTQVVTKADHNLMAGLTPAQMAAANRVQPAAPSLAVIAQSGEVTPDKASECAFIDTEIKHLDALARQPLSGQMQDWITAERKELRDRQFRIPCR
jgi:hypothetical protein